MLINFIFLRQSIYICVFSDVHRYHSNNNNSIVHFVIKHYFLMPGINLCRLDTKILSRNKWKNKIDVKQQLRRRHVNVYECFKTNQG